MDYDTGAAITMEEVRRAVKAKRAELMATEKEAARKARSDADAQSNQNVDNETIEK